MYSETDFDYAKYTVLAVDDNPANLSLLDDLLQGYGFRVLAARDGESAIKRAVGNQPDLILLDVMMPGIDGFQTCQRLKAESITESIPIIFMTALASTEDKVKGFTAGAVDYVTKPFQTEEVLARIVTHLRMKDMNKALQKQATVIDTTREISQRISSILKLDHLLIVIVELIQIKFGYSFCGVWLTDKKGEKLTLAAASGIDEAIPVAALSLSDETQLPVVCFQNKQAIMLADTHLDKRYRALPSMSGALSCLMLPIRFGKEVFGVLDIRANETNDFSHDIEVIIASLASQIAIAINNARLYSLEEERVEALKELNESKDKFFSIVAHDLRAPFMPLLGTSKLLSKQASKTGDQDIQEMADSIHNSANNVFNFLENLLEWSRMQRGHIEYTPTTINLKNSAKNTTQLLQGIAKNKEISLVIMIADELQIYADERMLETILRNLISNALKFTPANGQVTVSASICDGNRVEIAITDTGVGIKPQIKEKLFQTKTIVSTNGTANEKGTGLGLLICQEMIEKNNGRVWVESEIGKGTSVRFTIPQQRV